MKANRNLHRIQRQAHGLAGGLKELTDDPLLRGVAEKEEAELLFETRRILYRLASRLHLKARERESTSRAVRTLRQI